MNKELQEKRYGRQQYAIGDVAGGKGTQIFIEKSQQGGIERNLSKVTKLE